MTTRPLIRWHWRVFYGAVPTDERGLARHALHHVLLHQFLHDMNGYVATHAGVPVRTLTDVIAFGLHES